MDQAASVTSLPTSALHYGVRNPGNSRDKPGIGMGSRDEQGNVGESRCRVKRIGRSLQVDFITKMCYRRISAYN